MLAGTIANYQAMRAQGAIATLVIAPWTHMNRAAPIGERDFGVGSQAGLLDLRTDLAGHTNQLSARRPVARAVSAPPVLRSAPGGAAGQHRARHRLTPAVRSSSAVRHDASVYDYSSSRQPR